MNIFKLSLSIVLSSSLVIASAPTNKPSKKEKELVSVVKMGKRGTKTLLGTLGRNMKKRMKDGGVMKALDFCSNEAFTLTEGVNKKLPNGVRVKRNVGQFALALGNVKGLAVDEVQQLLPEYRVADGAPRVKIIHVVE